MDRPFMVGDTIAVVAGTMSYVGEVVEVAALRTHLALEDGSMVAIPNRSLADMIITNKSKSGRSKCCGWGVAAKCRAVVAGTEDQSLHGRRRSGGCARIAGRRGVGATYPDGRRGQLDIQPPDGCAWYGPGVDVL